MSEFALMQKWSWSTPYYRKSEGLSWNFEKHDEVWHRILGNEQLMRFWAAMITSWSKKSIMHARDVIMKFTIIRSTHEASSRMAKIMNGGTPGTATSLIRIGEPKRSTQPHAPISTASYWLCRLFLAYPLFPHIFLLNFGLSLTRTHDLLVWTGSFLTLFTQFLCVLQTELLYQVTFFPQITDIYDLLYIFACNTVLFLILSCFGRLCSSTSQAMTCTILFRSLTEQSK